MVWGYVAVFLLTTAVSYYQAKKAQKKAKKLADSMAGVLLNKESNIEAIPVVYGERRVGGTRVFLTTSGDDKHKYLYMALVLCEGEVESITDIQLDDVPIGDTRFAGLISSEVFLGSDTQAASTILPTAFNDTYEAISWKGINLNVPKQDYAPNFRLQGVAYIALRLEWNEEAFSGIPDVTALVKGKKVYDPRTTLTSWSANPALCIRDYLTNERYGKGLDPSLLDEASFIAAANDCDNFTATPYSGAVAPVTLLELNAVIDTDDELFSNLQKMLLGCRGFLPYYDGKYYLKIDQVVLPTLTLDGDTIIGGINVVGENKEDVFNQVLVKYPDPDTDWQPNTAVWPDPTSSNLTSVDNGLGGFYTEAELSALWVADDGETLIDEVELEYTTNHYAARDLARILCWRSRKNLVVNIKATSDAMDLAVGDLVNVTHPTPSWTAKPFQVDEINLDYDGTVNLRLREYSSEIYAYDLATEAITYVDTVPSDPFVVLPPTNLVVTAGTEIGNDGIIRPYLDISWDAPTDALVSYYIVEWTTAGTTSDISTRKTYYRLYVTNASNTFDINIYSVSTIGAKSPPLSTTGAQPIADNVAPADPTSTSLVGELNSIKLAWTNPTDGDFHHIEINRSNDSVFANSGLLATTPSDTYTDGEFNAVSTFHYWIRAKDNSGNASNWVYMGSATSRLLIADDFGTGIIGIDFLEPTLKTSVESIADKVDTTTYDLEVTDIYTAIGTKSDQTSVDEIIGDIADTRYNAIDLAEDALKQALDIHRNAKTMADAGIQVNPNDGSVYIYGLETYRGETDARLSSAEIRLDGAEANINLKASVTYVDSAIATAVIDPSQIAELGDIYARLSQAELDIDGAEANIALKADVTLINDPVTGLDARVTQAEIDIDGAEAAILLKASQTDLDAIGDRVTTAEININALDAPSITQTVKDVVTIYEQLENQADLSLAQILELYDSRKILKQDLAFAQQSITADVNDVRQSTATARLELKAIIDQNAASILSEQTARADADSALASDITTLQVTTAANAAAITTANTAITTNETAIAQNYLEVSGRLDTAEGNITQINTVDLSSTSAIAQAVAQVQLDIGESGLAGDITNLQDLVADEAGIRANDITSLAVSLGFDIEDIHAQDMATILKNYEDRKELQAQLAIARQSLTADINDSREANAVYRLELLAAIDDNKAAITNESIARANEDSALAQTISSLSVTVDANTASITNEQIVRANADSVIAQDVTTLEGRVDATEGSITQLNTVDVSSTSALVQSHVSLKAAVEDPTTGLAAATADITDLNTISVSSGSALASSYAALQAAVNDPNTGLAKATADIGQINFVDVTSTSAVASTLAQVSSTVGGHTTTIGQHTTSINGIEGRYTLGIDNNGHITGFGLISQMSPDSSDPASSFIVSADTFAITNEVSAPQWDDTSTYGVDTKVYYFGKLYQAVQFVPANNPPPNPTYWSDITDYAFAVYTTDTSVTKNGQSYTIPAGVYIRDGFIQEAAIGEGNVQTGAITNAKISGVIESDSNASDGNPKWSIDKTGGAVFRGIEIRADDGTLLMASGSAMDITKVANAGDMAQLDLISTTNASTYIQNAAIGTLQVAGQAITFPKHAYGNYSLRTLSNAQFNTEFPASSNWWDILTLNYTSYTGVPLSIFASAFAIRGNLTGTNSLLLTTRILIENVTDSTTQVINNFYVGGTSVTSFGTPIPDFGGGTAIAFLNEAASAGDNIKIHFQYWRGTTTNDAADGGSISYPSLFAIETKR